MYTILIVDDEKYERDGIKFLLNKYRLDLTIVEADDGTKALEYLRHHHVDILLTDIRMQFMNGMELVQAVRSFNENLKVIISSAYGEFDYARQAIAMNVEDYILKPVDVDEFIAVMNKAIRLCSEQQSEKEREERLQEAYRKSLRYEKEKVLLDLIHGLKTDAYKEAAVLPFIELRYDHLVPVLVQTKGRLFDSGDLDIEAGLSRIIDAYDYVNLNEYQSFILLKSDTRFSKEQLLSLGAELTQSFMGEGGSEICLVFGTEVHAAEDIHSSFNHMEQTLDYHFFRDRNTILFSDPCALEEEVPPGLIDKGLEEIKACIRDNRMNDLKRRIGLFFDELQGAKQYSSMFVKYICVEIIKEICENNKIHAHKFQKIVNQVHDMRSSADLKQRVYDLIEWDVPDGAGDKAEQNRKVIQEVIDIIHNEYSEDLSLEFIASKVYLSPSYLSHLFKKETGENLFRYITNCRLAKASHYLRNTNRKIAEISKDVGFIHLSYFCTLFKNHYGLSPAKYRERAE